MECFFNIIGAVCLDDYKALTVFSCFPVALKGAVYSRFCLPTYKQQQVNHKDVNERERGK